MWQAGSGSARTQQRAWWSGVEISFQEKGTFFLHLASKLPGSRPVCLLRTSLAEVAHPPGSNVAADRLQKAATPGVGKRDRQQWETIADGLRLSYLLPAVG